MSFDRNWLLVGANSIEAGTAYIAHQARFTKLDPPLVAAAYNAGRLIHQPGARNRWKLKQYPIGTGEHCDRFVRFFNDAVFVLGQHRTRPAVGLEGLLRGLAPVASPNVTPNGAGEVEIEFGENAKATDVTPYSRGVLEDILRTAGLKRAVVSSTSRTPKDQARVMYNNLETHGIEAQKKLYAPAGDRVIDVYARSKVAGKTADQIKLEAIS